MDNDLVQVSEGWLVGASKLPSDNFNHRPKGCEVDLLVIHNISLPPGEFGGGFVEAFFCNQLDCRQHSYFRHLEGLKVSAHLFVNRNGALTQFVNFDHRAWHAGESSFKGRSDCNDFSIGIELEGTDNEPYTEVQYQSLIRATRSLMAHYPGIRPARIVGHEHIAPERKTDPGPAFNWKRYRGSLEKPWDSP